MSTRLPVSLAVTSRVDCVPFVFLPRATWDSPSYDSALQKPNGTLVPVAFVS